MNNIWEEIIWMSSFNSPNPIINARHAEKLKNMYLQMLAQFPGDETTFKFNEDRFNKHEADFTNWINTNWPY